jgi:hypothetical protein
MPTPRTGRSGPSPPSRSRTPDCPCRTRTWPAPAWATARYDAASQLGIECQADEDQSRSRRDTCSPRRPTLCSTQAWFFSTSGGPVIRAACGLRLEGAGPRSYAGSLPVMRDGSHSISRRSSTRFISTGVDSSTAESQQAGHRRVASPIGRVARGRRSGATRPLRFGTTSSWDFLPPVRTTKGTRTPHFEAASRERQPAQEQRSNGPARVRAGQRVRSLRVAR